MCNIQHILTIDILNIALRWMSQEFTDDKSILTQVMAWCCKKTSHYMNQCWPSYITPYGLTGGQWVNLWRRATLKVTGMFFLFYFFSNIFIQGKTFSHWLFSHVALCTHITSIHIKYTKYIKSIFRSKSPKMRNIIASVYEQCMTIHIKYKW